MKDEREYIEQELSGNRLKIFLLIYPHEGEILVDTKALPPTAFLCALCDAIPFKIAKVGSKKKKERWFIPIDWVINDWGGAEWLVEAIRKRKQILMGNMEQMKTMVQEAKKMSRQC